MNNRKRATIVACGVFLLFLFVAKLGLSTPSSVGSSISLTPRVWQEAPFTKVEARWNPAQKRWFILATVKPLELPAEMMATHFTGLMPLRGLPLVPAPTGLKEVDELANQAHTVIQDQLVALQSLPEQVTIQAQYFDANQMIQKHHETLPTRVTVPDMGRRLIDAYHVTRKNGEHGHYVFLQRDGSHGAVIDTGPPYLWW